MTDSTAEPLWRGKTTQQGPWNTYSFLTEEDGDLPALDCRPGTEVEVWPAGDRTPTREQIRERLREVIGDCVREDGKGFEHVVGQLQMATRKHWADYGPANLDVIAAYVTEAVWELLHGQGDSDD